MKAFTKHACRPFRWRTHHYLWELVAGLALISNPSFAAQLEYDLDRNTPGVQTTLFGESPILGAVVVTGDATDEAGRYAIQVLANNITQGTGPIVCAQTSAMAGEVQDGQIGIRFDCNPNGFTRPNLLAPAAVALGDDGFVNLFVFDLALDCNNGDEISLTFQTTANNPQLGVNVNGTPQIIGSASFPAIGATFTCGHGDPPTGLPTPCPDFGYYVLDTFGGRHNVGNPFPVTGPLYFGDNAFARDMEVIDFTTGGLEEDADSKAASPPNDLAVLDLNGVVHYVVLENSVPDQSFFFPDGPEAVDVEMKEDNLGFWVLRVDGGVYAAGSAGDGIVGDTVNLQSILNIPFGGALPRDPNLDPSQGSIRAAALGVPQAGDTVLGFVVLDSQGGHYQFDGSGAEILTNKGVSTILEPTTVYPFFQGLDIARDLEVHPNDVTALIVYDGWGGTHPVPVTGGGADFIRNEGPFASPVGLPYLQIAFDDPSTAEDESAGDIDVNSVFRDLEFCLASTNDSNSGVYVLDAFGGVFAFGSTRANPLVSPQPILAGGPYFFPNLFAIDLEPTDQIDFVGGGGGK